MIRRLLPLWILLALGLLLLLLHLALPHLVRNYLNDKMADMGIIRAMSKMSTWPGGAGPIVSRGC